MEKGGHPNSFLMPWLSINYQLRGSVTEKVISQGKPYQKDDLNKS